MKKKPDNSRKTGQWEPHDYDIGMYRNVGDHCSLCGYEICPVKGVDYPVCPNCKAKMSNGRWQD